MKTATYGRKTFHVNAVQVTETNLEEVSKWCGGEVQTQETKIKNAVKVEKFVRVPVLRPLNEKQSRAFIGDWVLEAEGNYKVYTDRAFTKSFEEITVYTEAQAQAHVDGAEPVVTNRPMTLYTYAQSLDQLVDYPEGYVKPEVTD